MVTLSNRFDEPAVARVYGPVLQDGGRGGGRLRGGGPSSVNFFSGINDSVCDRISSSLFAKFLRRLLCWKTASQSLEKTVWRRAGK